MLGHSGFKLNFFKYTLNSVKCTSQVKKARSFETNSTNVNRLNHGLDKESLWTVLNSTCLVMLTRTETISFKLFSKMSVLCHSGFKWKYFLNVLNHVKCTLQVKKGKIT